MNKNDFVQLVVSQRMDQRIAVLEKRLADLPVELAEREARHSVMEAEAGAFEGDRKKALMKAQDLENDIRDFESRISKLELQKNTLRDAGAIAIAQHEQEEHRTQLMKAEEDALVLLEKAEGLVPQHAEALERISEDAVELAKFREVVAQDSAELEAEIAVLRSKRDERFCDIPKPAQGAYEELAPSRSGRPTAPLRGESCGGCGMMIPPNDRVKVLAADALIPCRGCQRILVTQELWTAAEEIEFVD